MIRLIPAAAVVLALGVSASAGGQTKPSLFPLADGNQWTLRDVETNAARTISVSKQADGLVLRGLPGAADLRVRWAGQTLQAWDSGNERWEALFRFGDPAGTRYIVRLGSTLLWKNLVVTLASKRARIEDFTGRTRVGTHFTFATKSKIYDAGLESMSFAPGIGPLRYAEMWFGGTRELALAGHRLK